MSFIFVLTWVYTISLMQIWGLKDLCLTKHAGSNYHVLTDNLFASPQLLRPLRKKGIAATGTV